MQKKKNQIHVSKREDGFPVETAPLRDVQYQVVVNVKKVSGVRSTFMVESRMRNLRGGSWPLLGPWGDLWPLPQGF